MSISLIIIASFVTFGKLVVAAGFLLAAAAAVIHTTMIYNYPSLFGFSPVLLPENRKKL